MDFNNKQIGFSKANPFFYLFERACSGAPLQSELKHNHTIISITVDPPLSAQITAGVPQVLMEKPSCLCLINDRIVMTGNYCFSSVQSVSLQLIHCVTVNKISGKLSSGHNDVVLYVMNQ